MAEFYGLDQAVWAARRGSLSRSGTCREAAAGTRYCWTSACGRSGRVSGTSRALKDRRHLYFDGFTGRPADPAFYDDRAVTFLDGAGLALLLAQTAAEPGRSARGAFTPALPIPPVALGPEALWALAQLPVTERDRFNLPEQVMQPVRAGTGAGLPPRVRSACRR